MRHQRMKALLLAATAALTLTACGGDDKDASHDSGDQNTAGDSLEDAGDAIQDAGDDILDAGEDILDPNDKDHADSGRDPADRHEDDALTGGDPTVEDAVTKQSGRIGVSYGQMLRNARVHDTDGFLKDGENAVSPDAL